MTVGVTLADRDARDRIQRELDSTLFVEAGAGTGKTRSLVDRIVALIVEGKSTVDRVAAITFTRSAASELRERITGRLEERARSNDLRPAARARVLKALDGIDQAAFQTIDSFTLSVLREKPLEAALPPVIELMDAVEAEIEFRDRWNEWLDFALGEGDVPDAIACAVRLGMNDPVRRLYDLAQAFHRHYELVRDVRFSPGRTQRFSSAGQVVANARRLQRLLHYNRDPDDRLVPHIESVLTLAGALRRAGVETAEAMEIIARSGRIKASRGSKTNWDLTENGENACDAVKAILAGLQDVVDAELGEARRQAIGPVLDAVARFVLEAARARREAGKLEFHDLLVLLRNLLRDSPEVLAHFRRRYTHILIDEFQDVDPLQSEIALLLTSGTGAGKPDSGALFVVGDPKQSIYRFRGADIEAVARTRRAIADEPAFLVHNFRTHKAIVEWVNHVFASWMGTTERQGQARYVPLATDIPPPRSSPPAGVHYIGERSDADLIGPVRRTEAEHVARIALSIGGGAWSVRDDRQAQGSAPRRSTWRDLCILVRSRTGIEVLERALDDGGVPYSLEGQSFVFASQQVRDLLAALAAIDDPSDEVALVGALRSPAFGCSDADLADWVARGGRLDYTASHSLDGRTASAFQSLARFHELRMTVSVPELIEEFVRERKLRELALTGRHMRSRLRLIQLVIDEARKLAEAGRPSLRHFVEWAARREEAGARMAEGGAADIDQDAVRVMTIHAAKGLEFPIVLVAGINSRRGGSSETVLVHRGTELTELAVGIGSGDASFHWGDYERLAKAERAAADAEEVRLMYVAATRAKDHLIVSMYRRSGDSSSLAARLAEHAGEDAPWRELTDLPAPAQAPEPVEGVEPFGDPDALERFATEREALVKLMKRPRGIAATSLGTKTHGRPGAATGGTGEEWEDRDREPWRRGRAATALGSAVHAVLQDVDLASGEGLHSLAAHHAANEGLSKRAEEVARLVEATLKTPVVRRAAAAGNYQREVFVAARVPDGDGTVIEGFVDLLFEDDSGNIVVIDYKTDRYAESESLADAARPYSVQLGAYATAIQAATGRKVAEAWIVFSRRAADGLEAEYMLPDVADAVEEALRAAKEAAGRQAS